MKKLIVNSALLSVLLVLGACTVNKGDGVDEAIKDALNQIGGGDSVDNMTKWSYSSSDEGKIEIYYLTDTTYKHVGIRLDPYDSRKIYIISADEGNLTKNTSSPLYNINKGVINNKEKYDTAYTFSSTKSREWIATKPTWQNFNLFESYFIVKESIPTELSMIEIDLKNGIDTLEGYNIRSTDMTEAIRNDAQTYKKQ